MKNAIVVCILLCSIQVFAQFGDSRLDSIVYSTYSENDGVVPWSVTIVTHDNPFQVQFENIDIDALGKRSNWSKQTKIFDTSGNLIEEISFWKIYGLDDFDQIEKREWVYDNNNRLTEATTYVDTVISNPTWLDAWKYEYLDYNSEGDHTIEKIWSKVGETDWRSNSQFVYEHFYVNGNLDSTSTEILNVATNNFTMLAPIKYHYNQDDQLIRRDNYYRCTTQDWLHGQQVDYEYNDNGLVKIETFTDFDICSNEEEEIYKHEITYTEDNLYDEIFSFTLRSTGEVLDESRTKYYRSARTTATSEDIVQRAQVQWSNTAGSQLQINITDLNNTLDYIIDIYDSVGRMVKHLQIENAVQFDESYHLSAGTYLLVLTNENGQSQTVKMIAM